MAKSQRHLTPPAFATWLVDLARMCCQPACAVDSRGGTMDTAGKVLTHPPAAEHDACNGGDDA